MSRRAPFTVIPWEEDFLEGLVRLALEETAGNISRAVFIFPHSRPKRYLSLLLRQSPEVRRPLLLPRMETVSSLFAACAGRILERPAWNAGLLDRVGLLLACVRAEAGEGNFVEANDIQMWAPPTPARDWPSLDPANGAAGVTGSAQVENYGTQESGAGRAALFLTEARRFFPWGVRMAALFEECFAQHRKPVNFLHVEEQVSPFAALLLSRLGRIFERYLAGMREREWTSPGLNAALAADHLQAGNGLPEGILADPAAHPIYIAGFHALTGAEHALFRHLWENLEARVVLHADARLVSSPAGAHWSCAAFLDWARQWKARLTLREQAAAVRPERRVRYYAGFDLHSQLDAMAGELADLRPGPAAVPNGDARFVEANPGMDVGSAHTRQDLQTLTQRAMGGPCLRGQTVQPLQRVSHLGPVNGAAAGSSPPPVQSGPDDFEPEPGPELEEEKDWAALEALEEFAPDHRADTLVALPDSGLLMPVLHHLPRVDVNISMGYPLSRSPVFRLVDTIIRLQEGGKAGGYYWRDLVDLIRHPYLKMLGGAASNGEGTVAAGEARPSAGLRRELHRLEEALRGQGRKYADPEALLDGLYAALPREDLPDPATSALLRALLRVTLASFARPECPADLAAALERLCAFLLEHGRRLWKRFPIDAECLYRLRHSLIPELGRSELARERFSPDTLFALLRSLLEAERVPFEAVPLVGLQVMGMLETRLLSFRRVLVVDAGEDSLPGSPAGDPLLPEALRPEIGLPPLHSREQVAAYTFFRLIAGAEEVVLFWQEGNDTPGLQERKKKKSRFAEELLWEEEQRIGRLLSATGRDGPLTVIESLAAPVPRTERGLAVTPPIRDLLEDLKKKPLSASLLDSYLRCPARFFHERLIGLAPADEVPEGDDPLAIGNLFHAVLQQGYAPYCGRTLPGGELLEESLGRELEREFLSSPALAGMLRSLPADAAAMLLAAGKKRLADYVSHQPPTRVIALETQLNATFTHGGRQWSLTGTADRIDVRRLPGETDESLIILDYKTGRLPGVSPSLWEDAAFWRRLEEWRPGDVPDPAGIGAGTGAGPGAGTGAWIEASAVARARGGAAKDPLAELAGKLESVQLPFYLLLHSLFRAQRTGAPDGTDTDGAAGEALAGTPALEAAWVALAREGGEMPLFPPGFSHAQRLDLVKNRIPALVSFILRHMFESDTLLACPGRHCDWCFCEKLCKVSADQA